MANDNSPQYGQAIHALTEYSLPADFGNHSHRFISQLCHDLSITEQSTVDINEAFISALETAIDDHMEGHGNQLFDPSKLIPGLIAVCGEFIIHKYGGGWICVRNPILPENEPWVCDASEQYYPAFIAAHTFNETEEGVSVRAVIQDITSSRSRKYPY